MNIRIKSCCGVYFFSITNRVANLVIEIEDPITLDLTSRQYKGETLIDCFKQVIEEVENNDSDK